MNDIAWAAGDLLWTPFDGTCAVLRLRRSGAPSNALEALVEPHWLRSGRHWLVIDDRVVRLAPGEPDRPSEGLHAVLVGQTVAHWKFGPGVVIAHAFEPSVGVTVARIRFENEAGERAIALGSGALRAALK